ncbi:MAG: LysM peptidoglycan-binding domain-containing protein [Candidatus Omnitrophota bacterium]|jgi:LysM repeat protein
MKISTLIKILLLGSVLVLAGCTVRSYPLTRERVNQSLTEGNRGYLQGKPPVTSETPRKKTRTVQIIEVELNSPIKFEKTKKVSPEQTNAISEAVAEPVIEGNRGYVNQSEPTQPEAGFEKYVVQKNDTLQKISMKFYSTSKKWIKIYEANKDTLKTPDKLYPGKTLNIPVEDRQTLKGAGENLK